MLVRRTLMLSFSALLGSVGVSCDREEPPAEATKTAEAGKDAKPEASRPSPGTKAAQAAQNRARVLQGRFDAGEDIRYECVGDLTLHRALKDSKDASEQQAWAALSDLCHVQLPRKLLEQVKTALASGVGLHDDVPGSDRPSAIATDLKLILEDEGFPKDGEAAKLASEAAPVLHVEIPLLQLEPLLARGKEACAIAALTVIDDERESLAADERGKQALARYDALCGNAK